MGLFLEMFKFSASAISFGKCLKLIKVENADLSLKRWLALKGRKSCANVKNVEGSSPLSLFIVL